MGAVGRFLEGLAGGQPKRHFAGIDIVMLAVDQHDPQVGERVVGQAPLGSASVMPFSTAGMNCRGTLPPTTLLPNSKPSPRPRGSPRISTRAYCPWPPVCFLCVYSACPVPVTVSR